MADVSTCVRVYVLFLSAVFSPLKAYVKRPGMSVAVLGVGGLGHLAVQVRGDP